MNFNATKLPGAFLVSPRKIEDSRGFFTRGWCTEEFAQHGLAPAMLQLNIGFSHARGTLRGLHYQIAPHDEAKFVRCTRGAIFDVVVDLRRDSPTYRQWLGVELSAENTLMLYAPEGCAHGYLTLVDDTETYYLTSAAYAPAAARGVRYDDPAFDITWPLPVRVISDADANWPDYRLE
jgi:dTDP-4-dehydrorhamnose 3,5-epimerase